jgi:hypothetical protein
MSTVTEWVDVQVPVTTAYNQWTQHLLVGDLSEEPAWGCEPVTLESVDVPWWLTSRRPGTIGSSEAAELSEQHLAAYPPGDRRMRNEQSPAVRLAAGDGAVTAAYPAGDRIRLGVS